jgi:hypothetical protein
MPPKKRFGKELPVEGSSQADEGQVLSTAEATVQTTHIPQITHPHTSTTPHGATIEVGRPEYPAGKPTTQAEVFDTKASALNTLPPPSQQHQGIKTQEDQQQDSEEEIKAIIEDELACLHQENELMWLVQEHMARQREVARRSHIM